MKQIKFLRYALIALAAMLAATAVFAFIKGNVFIGFCNVSWTLCDYLFYCISKSTEKIYKNNSIFANWINEIRKITDTGAPAIIKDGKDGKWHVFIGKCVGDETEHPTCSTENNDQINYHHIAEEVGGDNA